MKLDFSRMMFLDGATGTMLQRSGMRPGELPELMNLTSPGILEGIARAYAEAGSEIVCANTFGANARKLAGTGHRVLEVVCAAVRNARRGVAGKALVALDVGPLGELLEPMGMLRFEDAYALFAEVMQAGVKAGADLVMIETMTDLYEAKAALLAAREQTNLPVFVTMSFDETGRTFTGCTPASMARTLEGLGADAIGVNCSLGPGELTAVIAELHRNTRLPVIAKPNAGMPDPIDGHYELSPEEFAQSMKALAEAGASVVGGCCGTSPAYIAALKKALEGTRPAQAAFEPASFVCTPATPLFIRGVRPIGERLNPTGKKRLQQALINGDLDYITGLAVAQKDAGAAILDVNVGYPGVDEAAMLPRVVKRLQAVVDTPLQLDSVNPKALEAALRVYNGKAAVNSINGDEKVMAAILPVVKKYGAAVVGLTMDEKGLPQSCDERVAIAGRIVERAMAYGISREDVWIDCLTMTVSAQQGQAVETLKAVRRVSEELGLQTVLGVSNISFGLPSRLTMTQAFLTQALQCGLTLPIINPNQQELMDMIAAHRALHGEDVDSRDYVARFASETRSAPTSVARAMTLEEAVCRGLKAEASSLARAELRERTELEIVETCLIPALNRVGADYEAGKAFLPQLLSAAQAAQGVFDVIKASLAEKGGAPVTKGRLAVATVKGDIHDIGKNIVKTVLENYGYEVLDLGRDVPPETIVDAVAREKIRLVGLSALMTTTLGSMEETVRMLKALPEPPWVFVGGAVVTQSFADAIGADAYTKDAKASVEVAQRVFGDREGGHR